MVHGMRWPHLDRRRAEVILERVAVFAALAAPSSLAFIALDAALLPAWQWQSLAAGRVALAAAFTGLAIWALRRPAGLRTAVAAVGVLFIAPALFVAYAHAVMHDLDGPVASPFLATAYSFVPFLLACGIAAFPLVAREAAALALLAFGIELYFQWPQAHADSALMSAEAFWLLFLVAAIAGYAATSQARLLAALVGRMIRDPLTGCLRRDSGEELLEAQLAVAARQGAPLAVMFADLDRFKEVNDAFGHEAGDHVLAAAAEGLRRSLRESDTVLRWGGEEFVVVLPNATAADAVRLLDRIRARGIARAPDGRRITLSVGVAERLEDRVGTAAALVEIADRRMYQAKQAGRDRYVSTAGAGAVPLAEIAAARGA